MVDIDDTDENDKTVDSFVPCVAAAVASVILDGEAVLLDGRTCAMHVLNREATLVWAQMDGTTSLADIVAQLVVDHRAGHDQVRDDVLHLVLDLGRRGLLDRVQKSPDTPSGRFQDHPP